MTGMRTAPDARAADWVVAAATPGAWGDVVRYGPPGFAVSARVGLPRDEEHELWYDRLDASPADWDPDGPPAVVVTPWELTLRTLAAHTTTPDEAYAAVWEGWRGDGPPEDAPVMAIPHREMRLFVGPLEAVPHTLELWSSRRAEPPTPSAGSWADPPWATGVVPHLVWPADRAWVLACDVDEEITFGVGCSRAAYADLRTTFDRVCAAAEPPLAPRVHEVAYGARVQTWGDETVPDSVHFLD